MTKKATLQAKAINDIVSGMEMPYDYKSTKKKLDDAARETHEDLSKSKCETYIPYRPKKGKVATAI